MRPVARFPLSDTATSVKGTSVVGVPILFGEACVLPVIGSLTESSGGNMVRRLPNLIFIVSLTLLVGCWGDQMKVVMDSAVNGQIKMMEAKAKIDKEKRQEKYSIEGTIKSVVMREKEIPDPDPKNLQKKEEPTEKGVKIEMVQPKITVKFCVVVFADGREKEFDSVPSMPLDVGTYYRIEYNGMGEITGANPVKK